MKNLKIVPKCFSASVLQCFSNSFLKPVKLVIISVFIFSSCKKIEIQTVVPLSKPFNTNSVNFFGEELILREDVTALDVKNYIDGQNDNRKRLKINAENNSILNQIPNEIFFKLVNTALLNYPDLNKEEFSQNDFEKLKKGLPNLKNLKEASNEKKTIVYEYVNLLIIKDVEKLATEYLKKNKGAKILASADCNPTEMACRNSDPVTANNVAGAAALATQFTQDLYGTQNDRIFANSFKHASWNAISVRYVCVQTKNKWKGLQRTKKFTCAHEYDPITINVKVESPDAAMDLHNNLVGRTYMYNRVGQSWLGYAINVPDVFTIKADFYAMNKQYKALPGSQTDILALTSAYSWNSLEDHDNAMDYYNFPIPMVSEFLVYIEI